MGTAAISDPERANRAHMEMHAAYKVLRSTEQGRAAIWALTRAAERSVRCAAAAHSLEWKPALARGVLETLRDSDGPFSFEAQMVLREYDAGRLTFDY